MELNIWKGISAFKEVNRNYETLQHLTYLLKCFSFLFRLLFWFCSGVVAAGINAYQNSETFSWRLNSRQTSQLTVSVWHKNKRLHCCFPSRFSACILKKKKKHNVKNSVEQIKMSDSYEESRGLPYLFTLFTY